MSQPVIHLSQLKPLSTLRLRTSGAYEGTVTEPGTLVSDGKLIFARPQVPPAVEPLADRLVAAVEEADRTPVPQATVQEVFEGLVRRADKKAEVIGQIEKPEWIRAALDNLAVLRYGRGGSIRYVFTDAHRLLLLRKLAQADEIRCEGPQAPVLLCRQGRPVGGLTALRIDPAVER